jgi:hypothetical protein
MKNITIEVGIIKKCGDSLEPLRGYDLIVVEDQKYEIIPEGQKKGRTGWSPFSKKKSMEVFAVSTDTKHLIEFKKAVNHSDGIHSFFIDISIDLKVGTSTDDKTTLVKRMDKDPVQIIKDEAYKIIAGYLKITDWNRLSNNQQFQSIRSRALEDMVSAGRGDLMTMFDVINTVSIQYGLAINNVDFDITIPDIHIKDKIAEDKIKIDEKIRIAEIEKDVRIDEKSQILRVQEKLHDNELRELERIQKLKDTTYDTAGNYIDKVGQNIADGSRSVKDAMRDINEVMQLQAHIGGERGLNKGFTQQNEGLLLSAGDDTNSMVNNFYEIVLQVKQSNIDKSTQRKLLSALFHLAGGLLGNESSENMEKYSADLHEISLSKDLRDFIIEKFKESKNNINSNNIL